MAPFTSLILLLSIFGSVFSGFIDPQILELLRSSESSSIYVLSPTHYVPSSFLYGFGQPAVESVPSTNDLGSISVNSADADADSAPLDNSRRLAAPTNRNFNSASSREIAPGRGRISGTSARPATRPPTEQQDLPPQNDDLPPTTYAPKKDYLPPTTYAPKKEYLPPTDAPKKEEAKSPEYLPPKKEEAKSPEYLPPKNDYLPPTTAAPAQVQPAPFIFKSYVEPGFSFGEFPLNLVPIPIQEKEVKIEATKDVAKFRQGGSYGEGSGYS